MSSSIYFRFKSQRELSKISFDGLSGLTVFDVKRQIILKSKLDGDFNISIYNPDTGEEYKEDDHVIPRSTSIVVKRLPAPRTGRGNAAIYLRGEEKVRHGDAKARKGITSQANFLTSQNPLKMQRNRQMGSDNDTKEEAAIQAMMAASSSQWEKAQNEMANIHPTFHKRQINFSNVPNHPLPPGYICYRCGQKGHWIQNCPTNNDPEFDGKKRVRRTTGIPKSFLKVVEKDEATMTGIGSGIMINADGELVQAIPDSKAWELYKSRIRAPVSASDVFAMALNPAFIQLGCSVCHRLARKPVRTPCCETLCCFECIEQPLLDNDYACFNCGAGDIFPSNCKEDCSIQKQVDEYVKSILKESKTESEGKRTLKNDKFVSKEDIGEKTGQQKQPSEVQDDMPNGDISYTFNANFQQQMNDLLMPLMGMPFAPTVPPVPFNPFMFVPNLQDTQNDQRAMIGKK